MPPIVISRQGIDPATAPPKASPRRPGRRKKGETLEERGKNQRSSTIEGVANNTAQPADAAPGFNPPTIKKQQETPEKDSGTTAPIGVAEPSNQPANQWRTTLWQYLRLYLPANTQPPHHDSVEELLPLERHRGLSHTWKLQLANGYPSLRTLCAVLVYLSGSQRVSPCEICARFNDTEATETDAAAVILPFPGCIGLPAAASATLNEYFGATACCNGFYQSVNTRKRTDCVSRFSLSSSDRGGTCSVSESVAEEEIGPETDEHPNANNPDSGDSDASDASGRGASIDFPPATVRNSAGYKTALAARMAGRPKMVSIRKVSAKEAAAAKTKRQSSIRRLAAKLGAKAARREVAVYRPSELVVQEDRNDEKLSPPMESGSGARRSRRLLDQQREQRPASNQSVASKVSEGSRSPSKPSKLWKREKKRTGSSPASSTSKIHQAAADAGPRRSKPGAVSSLPLMMADWEIAPGRIHVGAGEDAESEYPYQLVLLLLPCSETTWAHA